MSESWKKLAFKAAIGVALFALANLAVFHTSGFFERERRYHETVEHLFERPDVSTVLMGDSHVAEIPRDLLAPGAYNLAAGGDGYREIYAKLRYTLDGPQNVKTVLLTADYHMFGAGRVQSSNRSFVDRYLLATVSPIGYEKNWLSTLFNLAPLCNDDFVQYLKRNVREMVRSTARGGRGSEQVWADLPQDARDTRALRTGLGDHAGVGEVQQPLFWFGEILKLAQQHGLRVIAVRYPTSAGYRSQVPAAGKAVVDAQLARLGMPIVVDLGQVLQEPNYFADEDHVNGRGAAVLLCLLEQRTSLQLAGDRARYECDRFAGRPTQGGS